MRDTKNDRTGVAQTAIIVALLVWVSQTLTFGSVVGVVLDLPFSWRSLGAIAVASFVGVVPLAVFFYFGLRYLTRVGTLGRQLPVHRTPTGHPLPPDDQPTVPDTAVEAANAAETEADPFMATVRQQLGGQRPSDTQPSDTQPSR